MRRISAAFLALSLLTAPMTAVSAPGTPIEKEEKVAALTPRKIDLVLALDTSNSMDGLINSAKARLWDIVNELARAKPQPELRVALYTYGNDGYARASGWVRKESDFTKDLDALYQQLSAVRTNGGTEYVARVTKAATDELAWDDSPGTLKILFVAGNEAATQDPDIKSLDAAKAAITKGIIVNTLYCGPEASSDAAGYAAIAKAADGKFAVIDQDRGVKIASTPYDTKLAELSGKLNKTYVGYGSSGRAKKEAQEKSDGAASAMGTPVAAARAATKAGKMYDTKDWDVVSASEAGAVDVSAMPAESLPDEMKGMDEKERKAFVDGKSKERAEIQKEIAKLSAEREKFIQEETKKQSAKGQTSLDQALKQSIREQASKKGFEFDN